MFVLAGGSVWPPAVAEFEFALVEVFLEFCPLFGGARPVFLGGPERAAGLEEVLVVADDVLVEDRDIASGGLQVEVSE